MVLGRGARSGGARWIPRDSTSRRGVLGVRRGLNPGWNPDRAPPPSRTEQSNERIHPRKRKPPVPASRSPLGPPGEAEAEHKGELVAQQDHRRRQRAERDGRQRRARQQQRADVADVKLGRRAWRCIVRPRGRVLPGRTGRGGGGGVGFGAGRWSGGTCGDARWWGGCSVVKRMPHTDLSPAPSRPSTTPNPT
jgi:hypothetical protein